MTRQRRLGAAALCVLTVLAMLASFALIIHEADHDCRGEDCAVCRAIALGSRMLRIFGAVLFALLFAAGTAGAAFGRQDARGAAAPAFRTLVGWKVRLNN